MITRIIEGKSESWVVCNPLILWKWDLKKSKVRSFTDQNHLLWLKIINTLRFRREYLGGIN